MAAAKAIFVLGMHRGGTSLVAGLLRFLGVYLGPESMLLGTSRSNPLGHFEFGPFEKVNESILAALGAKWNRPPDLPQNWLELPAIMEATDRTKSLISEHLQQAQIWGFKDPRACLILPFWTRVAGRPVEFVVVGRNPLDVALSLKARDKIPINVGADLWLRHMRGSLDGTKGTSRALFLYDSLLDDFDAEFARLTAFVGAEPRTEEARQFVRMEFRHHKSSLKDLEGHTEIAQEVKDTYIEMVEAIALDRSRRP